jgi:hypothetical protein
MSRFVSTIVTTPAVAVVWEFLAQEIALHLQQQSHVPSPMTASKEIASVTSK